MFNYYYYRNFILFKPLYDEGYTKKIFLLFYFLKIPFVGAWYGQDAHTSYFLLFYLFTLLLLKELSLVCHAYVQSRLVVVLLLELAIAVFCLHADLWQGIVVDATCKNLLACVLLRTTET